MMEFDISSCTFTETHVTEMDSKYFAEGVTVVEESGELMAYQLTWQENEILKWNLNQ